MSDTSTWLNNINPLSYPTLNKDLEVDVAIIGAGITGLTAAYILSKTTKKVVVIDKYKVGGAATGWTTAIITQYVDNDLQTLVSKFSKRTAKFVWSGGQEAINFIDKTVSKEKINCEFIRVPYYVHASNSSEIDNIKNEFEAATKIGIKLEFKNESLPEVKAKGYLKIPNQAKFNPVKYVSSLSKVVSQKGVSIFENTEVSAINNNEIITKHGIIKAKDIIVATHLPFNEPKGLKFKKAFYKTYMLEFTLPPNSITEACYQDLKSPYHYMRVDKQKGFDRVLLGGEDHRNDIPVSEEKSYKSLEEYFKKILPKTKYKITNKWGGKVVETIDGLPYIGNFKENPHHYYATGFSGNGMTFGTLSAMMITDEILGNENKYVKVFDPSRFPTMGQLISKFMDYSQVFFGGVIKNIFK